ncbi:MAG: pyridine nucleotide-disulfide oxidoreductase [Ignavibacteriae bacterium]|nr:pyridine nucleotide-disulfide oxidoreductase [Ignavibacteriota bacterium]
MDKYKHTPNPSQEGNLNSNSTTLQLKLPNFNYHDLFKPEKLADLTHLFFEDVKAKNLDVYQRFDEYRKTKGEGLTDVQISSRLTEMAPYLSEFVAHLFGVETEAKTHKIRAEREQIIFTFKKEFFTRRALKKVTKEAALNVEIESLDVQVQSLKNAFTEIPSDDDELAIAAIVMELVRMDIKCKSSFPDDVKERLTAICSNLKSEKSIQPILPMTLDEASLRKFLASLLVMFEQWLVAHYYRKTESMNDWVTFKQPHPLDYEHLVELKVLNSPVPNMNFGPEEHYRRREGFDLTDTRYSPREVMSEVDYCIFCHERSKDSCSKGFQENNDYKKNPLGYTLAGCPLDQKISESHALKQHGDVIGALAIIAIDNPMCPGTGHRICNDCMKACIYQKQDPVNIPQIETGILTDVLSLPWGFEIYSLLTRWNPLNVERPHAQLFNGKKILVVGMGPAGYTLSHYFLNEGFGVVGIDGLKIEPLPVEFTGDETTPFKPIKDASVLFSKLSERVLLGFGGVSEYGITVRWDKNFLGIIYLNLLRREYFRLYDGVRFGGTLTLEDIWELGFDHVSLATGAGKPTFVSMKNNLIRGIRKASDFLMALQLTGAGKKDSMANLQVRLPAIVIGGGLTAIDTATELIAYYPIQVMKVKQRYDELCLKSGKAAIDSSLSEEDKIILSTFLEHAEAIVQERKRAESAGEQPNYIPLIRKWGGVHLYYRKSMNDAPAYRLNHEEIIKAFEEGISFVENMSPVEAVQDEFGALREMVFERMMKENGKWKSSAELFHVPARSMFVAAGTSPNIMYEREYPGSFKLDKWDEFYESYAVKMKDEGKFEIQKAEEEELGFFTSHEHEGKFVSFYGDNHPDFEGNVVKAMASAKQGYKRVLGLFEGQLNPASEIEREDWETLVQELDNELQPHVVRVDRLTPTIVEVIIHAPQAARKFHPGQFYRLQNYEVDSPKIENTLLMMEGIALTGAWVDKAKGLLSLIALEMGASSRMIGMLKPGQRVVVMGPTGAPTEVPENSTVLLLGGGLGNAVLFSIAKAAKEKNNKVIYFAGYKKAEDIFKREEIEAATDVVIFSVDSGQPIPAQRPQDKSFVGNIIQAMIAYASGQLGEIPIPLNEASRVIAIGSDRMMEAVTKARHESLKPYLNECHEGIASINSPMQCMMKAVCAQCLQRHVIPGTNEEVFVFTCFNQDQKMDEVDFANLNSRLKANSLMEKISNKWLDYIIEKHSLVKV